MRSSERRENGTVYENIGTEMQMIGAGRDPTFGQTFDVVVEMAYPVKLSLQPSPSRIVRSVIRRARY